MKNSQNLQDLLNSEVTRREFLFHIGTAIVALIGISSIIGNLNSIFSNTQSSKQIGQDSGSYGVSAYSGVSVKPQAFRGPSGRIV